MNPNDPAARAPLPPGRGIRRPQSEWTAGQKLYRLAWAAVQGTVFRFSFHNWYGLRSAILQAFGAQVGRNLRIRRSVRIEIPCNLRFGHDVIVGDSVILYALGNISIGDRSLISQYVHLCAGSHEYRSPDYPLLRLPIVIGQDCWVAADAFIGPNVTIGDRTVVGARASVFKDLPSDVVVGGNPAKILKSREFGD